MKNLFVGNLSFQTSESELRSAFEPYGEVLRVRMMTDRETGRSRGFAFVEMANDEEAARAIESLNGKEVGGRALNISEARPKPERTGAPRAFGDRERDRDRVYSPRDRGSRREPRW
ncbi:MAG: RNA-binding protein [Acidobacteria bacterium]|nr:RNA-binding protein [Acidobacteriota bacterium]